MAAAMSLVRSAAMRAGPRSSQWRTSCSGACTQRARWPNQLRESYGIQIWRRDDSLLAAHQWSRSTAPSRRSPELSLPAQPSPGSSRAGLEPGRRHTLGQLLRGGQIRNACMAQTQAQRLLWSIIRGLSGPGPASALPGYASSVQRRMQVQSGKPLAFAQPMLRG